MNDCISQSPNTYPPQDKKDGIDYSFTSALKWESGRVHLLGVKNLMGLVPGGLAPTMSAPYSYETLKQMKGQAVKDIWHGMIGKPAGLKNTTGLKNTEEIIQAILQKQENPQDLLPLKRPVEKQVEPEEMGRKKKNILVVPSYAGKPLAFESTDIPLVPVEVLKRTVRKLHVGDTCYFLDSKTQEVFSVVDGKPGVRLGLWNAEERRVDS